MPGGPTRMKNAPDESESKAEQRRHRDDESHECGSPADHGLTSNQSNVPGLHAERLTLAPADREIKPCNDQEIDLEEGVTGSDGCIQRDDHDDGCNHPQRNQQQAVVYHDGHASK